MKIATALDREPSQYFKKWIKHHSQFFDKKDFIFINFYKNDLELKSYLESQNFENIASLHVTQHRPGNISFEDHFITVIQHGLDNNTPFIFNCPIEKIAVPGQSFYRQFIGESNHIINKLKFKVLSRGHIFIFLDSDELLLSENINSVLESDFEFLTPKAYSIIQNSSESLLDWDRPILEQRGFWKYDTLYEKPIITRKDIIWGAGRHAHHHSGIIPSSKVILLHMRDVCFDYLHKENERSKVIYPEPPKDHRDAWEQKEQFDEWVKKRQGDIVPISNNYTPLFKKYNV